jgi:hypothetical protein
MGKAQSNVFTNKERLNEYETIYLYSVFIYYNFIVDLVSKYASRTKFSLTAAPTLTATNTFTPSPTATLAPTATATLEPTLKAQRSLIPRVGSTKTRKTNFM